MVEVFKGVDNKKTYYVVPGFNVDICEAYEEVARYKKTSVARINHYVAKYGVISHYMDGNKKMKALGWRGDYNGDPCIVIFS